jgi:type II secretory pathway pseudopilin PulG
MKTFRKKNDAFTIVELLIGTSISLLVGLFIAYTLVTGSLLFAKNTATNLSHNSLRNAIDRMEQDITRANGGFTLVSPTGAVITSGQAAGVVFDQVIGNPYIVTAPTANGIIATTASITITRSTATADSTPPLPTTDDVLLLDGGETARLRVASTAAGGKSGNQQPITVTLTNAVGKIIDWSPPVVKYCKLIRKCAYVVVPVAGRNELRYFPAAEAIINFSTATNYTLVDENFGTDAGDSTPFSTTVLTGTASKGSGTRDFLKMTVRIRIQGYDQFLQKREANNFSSAQRVEFLMSPRILD